MLCCCCLFLTYLPSEQGLAPRSNGLVLSEGRMILEQDSYHAGEVYFQCSLPQTLVLQMLSESICFQVPKLH